VQDVLAARKQVLDVGAVATGNVLTTLLILTPFAKFPYPALAPPVGLPTAMPLVTAMVGTVSVPVSVGEAE
jgi:hypothetical protein